MIFPIIQFTTWWYFYVTRKASGFSQNTMGWTVILVLVPPSEYAMDLGAAISQNETWWNSPIPGHVFWIVNEMWTMYWYCSLCECSIVKNSCDSYWAIDSLCSWDNVVTPARPGIRQLISENDQWSNEHVVPWRVARTSLATPTRRVWGIPFQLQMIQFDCASQSDSITRYAESRIFCSPTSDWWLVTPQE